MNRQELFTEIQRRQSFLCVGLDTDATKLPRCLADTPEPLFAFNRAIVDATADYCVAYKPNLAFYEAHGVEGLTALQKTVEYIRAKHPGKFLIADAKRGDIANTADMYAKSLLADIDFDAVTLSPYMGENSISPFLKYQGKWAIILALTSNKSYSDFQTLTIDSGNGRKELFELVLEKSQAWGSTDSLMYVVGATHPEMLDRVRAIAPDHFLLVPGVGAQGGSLEEVARHGLNDHCGLLVNSSRGIIYADSSENFAQVAGEKAKELQQQMAELLKTKGLI
ncbi:MAG: orotidine-5'-phosphate decarboxylase [Bacteroidetes bacterium]|nr:MAG: orotidine-5'-phosphate decarboxylase [Bacteroidota bacterium]